MKIYTRQGDDGSTSLFGGRRVDKAALRVEAYGTVDEASAVIGWARVCDGPPAVDAVLQDVQHACFRLGAWLASSTGVDPGVPEIAEADVALLEEAIDRFEAVLPPLKHFILPGGGEGAARLHVARTVTRRAERVVVALSKHEDVASPWIAWLNRLSDLLFVLARVSNAEASVDEVKWTPRKRGGGDA